MKLVLKTIQLVISLPIFWLSTGLLILACAINPALYPVFVKHAKNLGENK
jgi:hypothetical protein